MKYHWKDRIIMAGKGGDFFFTYWLEDGYIRQIRSPALPMRKTLEEAQADLDAWAKKKGLDVAR